MLSIFGVELAPGGLIWLLHIALVITLPEDEQQVLQCWLMWPMFASQEEDVALQDDCWNERYQNWVSFSGTTRM
jgi:hypothetical protein